MTRRPPLPGQVFQTVAELDKYSGTSGRYDVIDAEAAEVTTSMVWPTELLPMSKQDHKVVLDIDLPAQLIPSSTEGHFHLYIDHAISWDHYVLLLKAMEVCGLLEPGYVSASIERGYTAVRLPWVKKPAPLPPELQAELDAAKVPGEPF